jgi:predicted outer membrane repeat protein
MFVSFHAREVVQSALFSNGGAIYSRSNATTIRVLARVAPTRHGTAQERRRQ